MASWTGPLAGFLAVLFSVAQSGSAHAQIHALQWPAQREHRRVQDELSGNHYRLAAASAEKFLQTAYDPVQRLPAHAVQDALLAKVLAALRTDARDARQTAEAFIAQSTDAAATAQAQLALARWAFRKEDFAYAIQHYSAAGIENLTNAEISAAKFEQAYSLFYLGRFEEAAPLFRAIREVDGPYRSAGNYYYGLLAYTAGDYADALQSFERIDEEPLYRPVVPYYIAEVHYFAGDRAKALADAQRLLRRSETSYYRDELHLLAGQVLFEEGRYAESLPYFEHYYAAKGQLRKEELYEMAYAHYREGHWAQAVERFKPLSASADSLGQTAMYLLGDCYLQTGDKRGALAAFRLCADAGFIPAQTEAATLLAAKLAYELGYTSEAGTRLASLLTTFPASAFRPEALGLQSRILVQSGRYEEALDALESAGATGGESASLLQRARYGAGISKLTAGATSDAQTLLEGATAGPDAATGAAAHFWLADIAYRQGRHADVLASAAAFRASAGAFAAARVSAAATPGAAASLQGYAAYAAGDYGASSRYFGEARSAGTTSTTALLREADALQMSRDFERAAALYDQAAAAPGAEGDYARLQKAILAGLRGNSTEKARILQSLTDKSGSPYSAQARYELALQKLTEEDYRAAITLLRPLAEGGGPTAPKALLRLAYAQSESGQDSAAVASYRRLVLNYPGADERAAALDAVRAASVESGRPEQYAALLRESGLGDYSATLDSTYYAAAERIYERRQWMQAATAMQQYLTQYPQGAFAGKAQYYAGASLDAAGKPTEALAAYDAALRYATSEFLGRAAVRAAALAEAARDTVAAGRYYATVRTTATDAPTLQNAHLGLARAAAAAQQWTDVSAHVDTALSIPDGSSRGMAEATLLRGRAKVATSDTAGALADFQTAEAAPDGALAAEARYRRAALLFAHGKLTEAETAADAAIRASAGYDTWVVRGYFLIADVLAARGDFFNAKATLQSLARNSKDTAVRDAARKRLAEVAEAEKSSSKLKDEGGPQRR